MRSKELSKRQIDFFLGISGAVTVGLFFMSGIDSYRVLIVFAIYSMLKAFRIERAIMFVYLPAFIVTFYLDIVNGPLFSQASRINYFMILIAFTVADYLIATLFKKSIGTITQGQYFVECPSCHFNNVQLVDSCSNCSYKKGSQRALLSAMISPYLKGDKITPGLLSLLKLEAGEEILLHKRLSLFSQQLKNNERIVRKHLFITTTSMIILDYYGFLSRTPKSWREKDTILLLDVVTVEGKMKHFYTTMRPFLIVTTNQKNVYEIVFSNFGKFILEINQIALLIKKANPQVEIIMDLVEPKWKNIM